MARINGNNVLTVVRTAYLNVDDVYPIGSIYMSMNSTSPASLFGGTWERINSAFLYGTSDNSQLGGTGGEATHVLTENEMPNHSHNLEFMSGADSGYYWRVVPDTGYVAGGTMREIDSGGAKAKGGGQAHNNMPPYIKVAIWKRTA